MTTHGPAQQQSLEFARECGWLTQGAQPSAPHGTALLLTNGELAAELGVSADQLANPLTLGTGFAPVAMAYSGFQFGSFSPILGDGRAHLVREIEPMPTPATWPLVPTSRVDLHLKGSGTTPFSRPGSDGKAPLSAMFREYVIGEALHALGIPATRILAVYGTEERLWRGGAVPEAGGIAARAAASHIRVGTFHFAQLHGSIEHRRRLVRYCLDRHSPGARHAAEGNGESEALVLLREVAKRQARLVAAWMGVGFVHGVLNTDNVSISGESIDFGPCAFIDQFERNAVFSSIDTHGRYAYDRQGEVTQWNLARFAESLLDLIDEHEPERAIDQAGSVLSQFVRDYRFERARIFAAKFGIRSDSRLNLAQIEALIERAFELMENGALDFTRFHRALSESEAEWLRLAGDSAGAHEFLALVHEARAHAGTTPDESRQIMHRANPVYIARNAYVQRAVDNAADGNQEPLKALLSAVKQPFDRRPGLEIFETAPEADQPFITYCGT